MRLVKGVQTVVGKVGWRKNATLREKQSCPRGGRGQKLARGCHWLREKKREEEQVKSREKMVRAWKKNKKACNVRDEKDRKREDGGFDR